ncbi:MAG: thymidylate kinase [Methanobacterium sp.]|nr:MAG: thymidylate kinase [Methanobacterium sp.]
MKFIVIDGLDGAGKDTHAQLIEKRYQEQGTVILRTHPSSDNYYGIKAKNALLGRGKLNKIKASFYYALDVIRSVRLYYGKADTVIFVRYLMGVAYLPLPLARVFYWFFTIFLPTTPYMFFLDLEEEEALKRISNRDFEEIFENKEDLIKVRRKALKLTKKWHIVNTKGSIEDVQSTIDAILNENS